MGDPEGIAKGATRFTKILKELLIAEYAAKVITHSLLSAGILLSNWHRWCAALAVTRFYAKQC